MIVFCHQKDTGFAGTDVGISTKLCDEFYRTPTDTGICLTKNLDSKKILGKDLLNEYDEILETNKQSTMKIEGGTMWGEVTIMLVTDPADYGQSTEVRNSKAKKRQVKLQLHQPKELATMTIPNNYDLSVIPLTLEANNEYHIKVTPIGKDSSAALKSLKFEQRKCKLGHEISDTSAFTVYTEANCRYDCHVLKSSDTCRCVPWDFLNNFDGKECDVFGRTCFFDTMKTLAQSPDDQCPHCAKECDFIEFHKELLESHPLSQYDSNGDFETNMFICEKLKCYGQKEFLEYFYDINNTFTDTGFRNIYETNGNFYDITRAKTLAKSSIIIHLKFMKPEIDFLDVKYTTMDKLAIFGGNFGIFEMISGWSLFGILNLLLLVCKMVFGGSKNN